MKKPRKINELILEILNDEIIPREERFGVRVPFEIIAKVIRSEHDLHITRKETRLILDELYKQTKEINDGKIVNQNSSME